MSRRIHQKKSLGQVFLKTDWPVDRMVEVLTSWKIERVLEIGPGPGILSRKVADAGIKVTAVEKDDRFVEVLNEDMAKGLLPQFEVVSKDILKFDLEEWMAQSGERTAIIGNIPYNISSPLLVKVLPLLPDLSGVLFMTQLEFAKRVGARHNTKEYGSLSIFAQLRSRPNLEFVVPKGCFRPVPKVDSAVISFRQQKQAWSAGILEKSELVSKTAFSQRRKKLHNAVGKLMQDQDPASCPIDLNRRPETLTPEEFIQLTEFLYPSP